MVTVEEEIARELARETEDDNPVEWYAVRICQAFRMEDEDVTELIDSIEEHWEDFQEVEGIEIHRLADKKTGIR